MKAIKHRIVSEFLKWWSRPSSSPDFSKNFARPVRYQRGGGMDDEDAIWLIEQSMGHDEVELASVVEGGGDTRIELLFVDPVTLLRHRVRFHLVVEADRIVSVVEQIEG